jgi:predicted transcriptional regulator
MKAMTLRLSDDLAADLALVARADGISAAQVARTALTQYIGGRLGDARLRDRIDDAHAAERRRLETARRR